MTGIIAYLLAVIGFAALSLSMQKHKRQVFAAPPGKGTMKTYRALGFVLVSASVVLCMVVFTWARGLTIALGVATLAALTVIWLMTFRPTWLRYLCWLPLAER